jgi:hypothetical protein
MFSLLLAASLLLPTLYWCQHAYFQQQHLLHENQWLYTQCQDPAFFQRLSRHDPHLCPDVQALFAAHTPSLVYSLSLLLILLFTVFPFLLLPLYRSFQDQRALRRILSASSPSLLPDPCAPLLGGLIAKRHRFLQHALHA